MGPVAQHFDAVTLADGADIALHAQHYIFLDFARVTALFDILRIVNLRDFIAHADAVPVTVVGEVGVVEQDPQLCCADTRARLAFSYVRAYWSGSISGIRIA